MEPPGDVSLTGMAAMGEMTLVAVMNVLALFLGPHWAVSREEAQAWGKALEAWLRAQPPARRKALTKALGAAPTLNLLGTTALILLPRVQATAQMMEAKRGQRRAGTDSAGTGPEASPTNTSQPDGYDFAGAVAKLSQNAPREPSPGNSPDDGELRQEAGSRPRA